MFNLIKKFFLIAIILTPLLTQAGSPPPFDIGDSGESVGQSHLSLTKVDVFSAVSRIINYGLTFLGMISLILMLYAGFTWMWARGNESNIEKAKEMLKGAIIGLIIILASYAVSYYVFTNLASIVTDTSVDQTVPDDEED